MLKYIYRLNRSTKPEVVRADLHTLLNSLNPSEAFEDRMHALKRLMEWMRLPISSSNQEVIQGIQARNLRFKFLLQILERNEDLTKYFLSTFQEITHKGSAVRLYCITGLPENTGFFSELIDRIIQNILPITLREKDLAELFKLVFNDEEDAIWFETCPHEIISPFVQLIKKHSISISSLVTDQSDALIILGSQLSAIGISKQIRRHLNYQHISETSFFKLSMAINKGESNQEILNEVLNARASLQDVRMGLEVSGVSVDLIHILERISSLLNRIEMILSLQNTHQERLKTICISNFIGQLIRDERMVLGVKDFIRQNLQLITRKIVERAGDKGDSYIAHTPEERITLFYAASWAGVLTAFTALMKYWIGVAHLPLFFEGFFFFLNYALGFLLMQKWHLALSSKQPAYTASSLSKKFESFLRTKQLTEVVIEVRKILSSQLIAAIANLLWVVPVIALFDSITFFGTGKHIMGSFVAEQTLQKHRLWSSLTFVYAAFTGILLWLSSVFAGWTENWIVFRGIPNLLKESSHLRKSLGKEMLEKFADKFPARMAGVAGNLSIAFFLAAPIIIGKITGLPLDIRHVTLAAGTITLGLAGIEWGIERWPLYLEMILTVFIIGILNFGISFYCSIRMAAMARNMNPKYLKIIFRFALKKPRSESSESN